MNCSAFSERDFRCGQMEVIGHDHKFMQQKPLLSTILRQPRTLVRGPPEVEPCDRIEEARGVRQSSRSRKTYGLIGELGAFSPGLKPGHCKIKLKSGAGTIKQVCRKIGCLGSAAPRPGSENVETPDPGLRPGLTSAGPVRQAQGRLCGTH
jgi:hypothetical protein